MKALKSSLFVICLIMIASVMMAQAGIGTTDPHSSSVLDVTSTNKGFLPPRVASVSEISTPAEGLMVYDEANSCIRFYNGSTWSDCVDGTALRVCAVKINTTDYVDFLCHNLGADNSLDPHTPALGLHGAMIQWGKKGPADWVASGNDGSLGFAKAPTSGDANTGSISLWSGTEAVVGSWNSGSEASPTKVTANDPCPSGFRVPTQTEWAGVADPVNNTVSRTGAWSNSSTNYGSAIHFGPDVTTKVLTLPAAGGRYSAGGALGYRGGSGVCWSSTELGRGAYRLYFLSSNVNPADGSDRTYGFSVHCIAE